MIATVRTNKLFNGKIYAKDNPNSCVVDVDNKIEFSIKMGYADIECNVKRKSQGFYANEVIIQVSNFKHFFTPYTCGQYATKKWQIYVDLKFKTFKTLPNLNKV